jgi:hypothetical protein
MFVLPVVLNITVGTLGVVSFITGAYFINYARFAIQAAIHAFY